MKKPAAGHLTRESDKAGLRIQVAYRPISELKLDPKNPRAHSPKQLRQIARSIETFGFVVPALIDAAGKVIAGHGRIMACQLLGRTEVPTICLDHLTQAQAKAFTIADNRLTEISAWNDQLLAQQLRDLSVENLDFSLEVTGFDMGEIDMRIEGLTSSAQENKDAADDLSALPSGPAVTRPGDLWQLGEHRVYCGDARHAIAYAALMQTEQAEMVFTDPPYNVRIDGNVSGLGSVRHRDFAMASGEMSEAEFKTFLTTTCSLHARHSAEGALHFICMDWRHMAELLAAGREVYTELKNLCVWAKDNAGMGSLYRSRHELVFVFKHGRGSHRNNIQLPWLQTRSSIAHRDGTLCSMDFSAAARPSSRHSAPGVAVTESSSIHFTSTPSSVAGRRLLVITPVMSRPVDRSTKSKPR